jgi:hypothetical protein
VTLVERCDISIIKGVGGDTKAEKRPRSEVCQTLLLCFGGYHYVRSIEEDNDTLVKGW